MAMNPIDQKPLWKRALAWVLTLLQAAALAGAWYLVDLSQKKAGVNHHVVMKKKQYQETLLHPDIMILYRGVIILILILLIYLWYRKGQTRRFLPLILATALVGLNLFLPALLERPASAYTLLLAVIIWILQGVKHSLNPRRNKIPD